MLRWIPVAACLLANVCFAARPVIFDSDMGNDIEDALALAMLHALTDRGECELIGVTLTNANPAAVPYIRMINRFYGRGDLPVGAAIKALKDGTQDGYRSTREKTRDLLLRVTVWHYPPLSSIGTSPVDSQYSRRRAALVSALI